jgi:hypothetical protein
MNKAISGYSNFLCMTCDVEIEKKEDLVQIEKILQMFHSYHIKGTFFFLLSSKSYSLLEEADVFNHFDKQEFGVHIHWTKMDAVLKHLDRSLGSVPIESLEEDMVNSINRCKKLGMKPKSFRAGGLSQTTSVLRYVTKCGFEVDSSVAADLSEKDKWFQNHQKVPYRSWYFPDKRCYSLPAKLEKDRMGILEIPVSRLIPSSNRWFPYTLTPTSPFAKVIINQWLLKSRWEKPLIITPIFHSYGTRAKNFSLFFSKLRNMIEYLKRKKLVSLTMSEVNDLL